MVVGVTFGLLLIGSQSNGIKNDLCFVVHKI
jgi:hypothetical protein